MSVLAALTLLPAVLSLLGDRVNSLKVPYLGRRLLRPQSDGRTSLVRAWPSARCGARPSPSLVGVGVLLLLAAPALYMKTGVSGVSSFPDGFESKQALRRARAQFSAGSVNPVLIVVDGPATSPAVQTGIARLTSDAGRRPGLRPRADADGARRATWPCSPCR